MRRVIPRDSVRSVVKRALVAGVVAGPLLFGTATASAQSYDDKANDVLPCTGECSTHDQDLKGVSVSSSSGQVTFTIEQYGAFTDPVTCRCYFPQLHIYTGSALPAKPDYYTAEWTGSPPASGILRSIALFDRSVSQTGTGVNNCPTPGGFNGAGLLVDFGHPTTPSATSVTYSFPLTAIGSPPPSAGGSLNPRRVPARRRATLSPTRATCSPTPALPRTRQPEPAPPATTPRRSSRRRRRSSRRRRNRSRRRSRTAPPLRSRRRSRSSSRRRRRSRRRIRPSRRPARSAGLGGGGATAI